MRTPKDPLKARVLQINQTEAVTVRRLFAPYVETGTLSATRRTAQVLGFSPRKADHRDGEGVQRAKDARIAGAGECSTVVTAGKQGRQSPPIVPFSNCQLHYLPSNPVYRGMTRNKTGAHPGQQAAILDRDIWDAVQNHLKASAARKRHKMGQLGPVGPAGSTDAVHS